MRVFVSGQIDSRSAVRTVHRDLRALGLVVTHDWTVGDDIGDKLQNRWEAGRRAEADMRGVIDSDYYIVLTNNSTAGKGMYAELGAALALNEVTGSPEVFVLGPMNHLSIFYLHPAVVHVPDRAALVDVLRQRLAAVARPGAA